MWFSCLKFRYSLVDYNLSLALITFSKMAGQGKPFEEKWVKGKDPNAEKDRGQEEKGVTEEEMVR